MFTTLPMAIPPTHHHSHSSYTPSPLSSSPIHPSTPLHTTRQTLSSPILPSNSSSNPFSFNTTTESHPNYYPRHPSTNSPPRARKRPNPTAFSRRPIKANPLIHGNGSAEGKEHSRETRRKLFLKRVREDSEEARWKARGGEDEMLRTIWIAEERRRLERKAREGDYIAASQEQEDFEDEEEMQFSSSMRSVADEIAEREEEELEAMLSMIEGGEDTWMDEGGGGGDGDGDGESPYGSDDEEYDSVFMDALQALEGQNQNQRSFQVQDHGGGGDDRMDES